jgi:hypothetical protein
VRDDEGEPMLMLVDDDGARRRRDFMIMVVDGEESTRVSHFGLLTLAMRGDIYDSSY